MAKRTTHLPEVPEPQPGAATVTQDYSAALRPLLAPFLRVFVPRDRLDETVAAAAPQLYNGAREAWIATRGGTAEHGGVLILGADGRPYWRAGGSASTDAEGRSRFRNDRSLAGGETLLATVHTHPASTPPSPEDLANLVLAPEPLKMVHTQDALYVVEQTAEFQAWLEGEAAQYGSSVPAVADS
jgi:hypothetical protein